MYLEHQQKIYMKTVQDATKKVEKNGDRHARAKAIEDSCLKVQKVLTLEPNQIPKVVTNNVYVHHVTESK